MKATKFIFIAPLLISAATLIATGACLLDGKWSVALQYFVQSAEWYGVGVVLATIYCWFNRSKMV